MSGLAVIFGVLAIVAAYHCTSCFLGKSILSFLIDDVYQAVIKGTGKTVSKASESMRAKTARMSSEARKKSWYYKYQILLNDILLDLGWKQMGVTIEGLSVMIVILTGLICIAGWFFIRSIIGVAVLGITTYVVAVAALFSLSRSAHRNRKALLIAAEDLLCANMSKGLTIAIRDNINQIDPEIRYEFQCYLNDVDCNMPILEAIDRLNDRLGSKFDNFCEKAKDISINYQPGAEDAFLFNISSNAIETELDNEIYEATMNANMDYFATLALLVIFFFMTNSMYETLTEFYFKGVGRYFLGFYLLVAVAVYIYTQWQSSRRT